MKSSSKSKQLFLGIDKHLALLTIKSQAEATPVGQEQGERLAPLGASAAIAGACPQQAADAMTALHQQGRGTSVVAGGVAQFEGIAGFDEALAGVEGARLAVGDVVEIGVGVVGGRMGHGGGTNDASA